MSAVRGISQYQQAVSFETSRKEAVSSRVQAKTVTKTVGFRLGKFGVSYAAEDLEVDVSGLSNQSSAQDSALSGRSFAAELDIASVRRSMVDLPRIEAAPLVERSPSSLTRRLGTEAYAQAASAASAGGQSAAPRMLRVSV